MTKNGLDSFYTARYDREKKYGPMDTATRTGLDSFYAARYDREKNYGPLPDTFGAQRHEPARIKRSASASN